MGGDTRAFLGFRTIRHPLRGAILLMCTDGATLSPLDIIRIYGLRLKLEVSFKQALRVIGAYAYHFWVAAMTLLRRVSGNQYLHNKSEDYRDAVRRKIAGLSSPHPARPHRPGPASDPLGR
jgi:hypothetical protein